MASEPRRGCGYRNVGGLYLCGGGLWVSCDRLPLELKSCPVCGAGIHFNRSMTEINPLALFGVHEECKDTFRPCPMCDPTDAPAYIMTVGKKFYSPESFMAEAIKLGVSKCIGNIPKNLKLGETRVYLAHPEAVIVPVENAEESVDDNGQEKLVEKRLGVFCAFVPDRIEMPVWESNLKGKKGDKLRKSLEKRGITPVPIRDGDEDHKPKRKKR